MEDVLSIGFHTADLRTPGRVVSLSQSRRSFLVPSPRSRVRACNTVCSARGKYTFRRSASSFRPTTALARFQFETIGYEVNGFSGEVDPVTVPLFVPMIGIRGEF